MIVFVFQLTEHRVATFSHDLIPDYLRTRPNPEVESRYSTYESRASGVPQDQQTKQLNVMDKITRDVSKLIARERDDMDAKSNARSDVEKTHTPEDTHTLLAAMNYGKGIKMNVAPAIPTRPSPAPQQQNMMVNKVPSTIKTNIKAANQVHPYQRQ